DSKFLYTSGAVVRTGGAASAPHLPAQTPPRLPVGGLRGERLILEGLTPPARAALGELPVTVEAFPFKIGRKTGKLFSDLMGGNDLAIANEEPYQVSRHHCSVNKLIGSDGYFVEDLGSTLGTWVNGLRVGGPEDERRASLTPGDNELVLGLEDSPFRFALRVG